MKDKDDFYIQRNIFLKDKMYEQDIDFYNVYRSTHSVTTITPHNYFKKHLSVTKSAWDNVIGFIDIKRFN